MQIQCPSCCCVTWKPDHQIGRKEAMASGYCDHWLPQLWLFLSESGCVLSQLSRCYLPLCSRSIELYHTQEGQSMAQSERPEAEWVGWEPGNQQGAQVRDLVEGSHLGRAGRAGPRRQPGPSVLHSREAKGLGCRTNGPRRARAPGEGQGSVSHKATWPR